MEAIGTDELDPTAILDYFAPLSTYLDEQLKKSEEATGWESRYASFYQTYGRNTPIEPVNNTVPIVVGCVLSALVVIVIIAYFIGRSRNNKKHKHLEGIDNPTGIAVE